MTVLDSFLGFFLAFIAKDFYDIFVQNRIKQWLLKIKKHSKTVIKDQWKGL